MDITPKKIVESNSRCFICSSASLKNNKIFIFGKSSLDIAEVIRSSLSVDVSRYSENSELFVCRYKCYQRLIKFNRASVKLKELKKEIEEVFKARENLRAKRLLHLDENTDGGAKTASTSSPRGKASKSLRFADTTCTSSAIREDSYVLGTPTSADRTPMGSYLSPIQSHPFGLVLRAFPNAQLNGSSPLPMLTSTPISGHGSRDTSQVKVSFKYPSKNVNKTLSSAYQSVGKALAHGVPSQIAGAIMNCQPLRQHVIEKVLKIASKEVTGLCSKSNPSMLRKTEKADLENFDFELLCNEWRERAPVFYAFLLTSCVNKRTKSNTWFGSLALAGSILLKQRNAEMSSTASVMGVLLKSKSIEVCFFIIFFLLLVIFQHLHFNDLCERCLITLY